jgi:hypothetical protein
MLKTCKWSCRKGKIEGVRSVEREKGPMLINTKLIPLILKFYVTL